MDGGSDGRGQDTCVTLGQLVGRWTDVGTDSPQTDRGFDGRTDRTCVRGFRTDGRPADGRSDGRALY